ncbi:MAG: hypothetical protein R3F60_02520 [bacterium]
MALRWTRDVAGAVVDTYQEDQVDPGSIERLIRGTLAEDYQPLEVVHYVMTEYVAPTPRCRVTLTLQRGGVRQETLEGQGVGFVEAAFRCLIDHFALVGLAGMEVLGFDVDGQMASSRDARGLDAVAQVRLTVQPRGAPAQVFEGQARSTLAATLIAVVGLVERALNADAAVARLEEAAQEARRAGRMDVLADRRADLARLRPWTTPAAA